YIGQHIAEFHADPPVIEDILSRLTRGETLREYPARLRCKDGSFRDVLISSSVLFEEGKFVHTRCFTRDVTDHKRIETTLRESEEDIRRRNHQFEVLLNEAPLGVYLIDADFRIRQINPTALGSFGHIPDLIGRDFGEVLHILWPKSYADELVGIFRHTLETGDPYMDPERMEQRLDREVLEYYEWRVNRIPLPEGRFGVVCYFRDISTQVSERVALAESEERLHSMVDSIDQLAWMARADGWIFWYNQRWYEYTGTTPPEMAGWGWQSVHDPTCLPEVMEKWTDSIRTGQPFDMVFPLRGVDGTFRQFLTRVHPVRDLKGDIVRWFGTNTDITKQTQIQQQLTRANEDLTQFAFAASHDLQEPLRMITAYSQMLLKGHRSQLDGEAEVCVGYVVEGAKRMRALLADLLSYTAIDTNPEETAERVDLEQVLQEVQMILKASIEESGAVVSSDPLPTLEGYHRAHFIQLFQNLIGNAIKYRSSRSPRIHVSVANRDGNWRFAVADNGIGIAPEYHAMIFGVFKRLHGKQIPGTGIGLAICQRVVERYNGRIWVESQLEKGATFYFTLPNAGAGKRI
ncbi:MAG: ATP-binding protein, partial [Acidobacteriota bacterium]